MPTSPILSQKELSSLEREIKLHHALRFITQIKHWPETAYKS